MKAVMKAVRFSCSVFVAVLASAGAAFSQTPLGEEFQVNVRTELDQGDQRLAVASDGSFSVVWSDLWDHGGVGYTSFAAARFYDPLGHPLTGELYPAGPPDTGDPGGLAFVVPRAGTGFRILWREVSGNSLGIRLRSYSPAGVPLGEGITVPPPDDPRMAITDVILAPSGRLVLAWLATESEYKVASLTPRGQLTAGEVFTVSAPEGSSLSGLGAGVDGGGNTVVVWSGNCGPQGDGARCDIFAQRLSRSGARLGTPIRVNSFVEGVQSGPRVAVAPDGSFLVVWQTKEPGNDNRFAIDVLAQRFSATGVKLGREIRLGPVRDFSELFPEVAADPAGNYLAVWSSFRREDGVYGWDILGQLFRRDGSRAGKEFRINTRQTSNEFARPQVAFGGNGTFVVVWNADDGDFDGVYGQRFAASAGDEPCVVRAGRLLCDTGRTGGDAELDLPLPAGPVVLGDADQDGRRDPCVFDAGRFDCDTDHRGAPFETTIRFGVAGDIPLFGDVDGDGRDEPCVFRAGKFLCDTGHNGGKAETTFVLGSPADQPLLGDLNRDGRDDACVFTAAGKFLCDTRHNGGADVSIAFGQAGDLAALGDYDGDGDDDPCALRAGKLFCDTAHDGGAAEAQLTFGQAGDRPLLGDLDGL